MRNLAARARRWVSPLAVTLSLSVASAVEVASADEGWAALPQSLRIGPPPGHATARGGVRRDRYHATWAFAGTGDLEVVWERRITGGVAANVLVDADGRAFVAGFGRVTQLRADGAVELSERLDFGRALETALLTDGARVWLDDARRIWAVEPGGELRFVVDLEAPRRGRDASLLPRPDGGLIASAGRWLFHLDRDGRRRAEYRLQESIRETLYVGDRLVVVTRRGRVFAWDGYAEARAIGNLGAEPTSVAGTDSALIASLTDGRFVALASGARTPRRLARLGPGAVLSEASLTPDELVAVGNDGTLLRVDHRNPGMAPVPGPLLLHAPQSVRLLSLRGGTTAWVSAGVPLSALAPGGGQVALDEVSCPEPVSLVPAGDGRLLLSCRSGRIWLVGSSPPAPASSQPPVAKPAEAWHVE